MKPYPPVEDRLRPLLRVAMPQPNAGDPCWTTQRARLLARGSAAAPLGGACALSPICAVSHAAI